MNGELFTSQQLMRGSCRLLLGLIVTIWLLEEIETLAVLGI